MNYEPPHIEAIARIDLRLEERPWRFAIDRAEQIDAHWARLVSANPHHYNGRVLLLHRVALAESAIGRSLEGGCLMADYKAFLAWRDFGFPDSSVSNIFAMAVLRSSDGAFLLGEMSASTANPGLVYFPAGTPDLGDLVGNAVDLEGSVLRELKEETGIDAHEVGLEPGWSVVFQGPRIACMKIVRATLSADELVARAAAFIAQEKQPELAALRAVFALRELDEKRMPDFILTYLRDALAKP